MNAYSEDLREKIVEALRRGMGKSQAARTFSVSLSSVKRYAKLAEEGRSLAPKKRPGSKPKLDQRASKLLEEDIKGAPFHHSATEVRVSGGGGLCGGQPLHRVPSHKADGSTRKKGADQLQNATSS